MVSINLWMSITHFVIYVMNLPNVQYVKNMQNVGYVTIAMWVLMLASLLTLARLGVRVKFQREVKDFK